MRFAKKDKIDVLKYLEESRANRTQKTYTSLAPKKDEVMKTYKSIYGRQDQGRDERSNQRETNPLPMQPYYHAHNSYQFSQCSQPPHFSQSLTNFPQNDQPQPQYYQPNPNFQTTYYQHPNHHQIPSLHPINLQNGYYPQPYHPISQLNFSQNQQKFDQFSPNVVFPTNFSQSNSNPINQTHNLHEEVIKDQKIIKKTEIQVSSKIIKNNENQLVDQLSKNSNDLRKVEKILLVQNTKDKDKIEKNNQVKVIPVISTEKIEKKQKKKRNYKKRQAVNKTTEKKQDEVLNFEPEMFEDDPVIIESRRQKLDRQCQRCLEQLNENFRNIFERKLSREYFEKVEDKMNELSSKLILKNRKSQLFYAELIEIERNLLSQIKG